jgi:hypothetical protein
MSVDINVRLTQVFITRPMNHKYHGNMFRLLSIVPSSGCVTKVCKEDKYISVNILYMKCQTEIRILYSLVKNVTFKLNRENDKTVKILGINLTFMNPCIVM